MAELADALDSKSSGRKAVWVRAPPPADSLGVEGSTFDNSESRDVLEASPCAGNRTLLGEVNVLATRSNAMPWQTTEIILGTSRSVSCRK